MKKFTIFILIMCACAVIGGDMVCNMGNYELGLTLVLTGFVVFMVTFCVEVFGKKGDITHKRVRITDGYFKNETGTIRKVTKCNDIIVDLDSGGSICTESYEIL